MIIVTVIVPVAGLLLMIAAIVVFRLQARRAAREEDHWAADETRLTRRPAHHSFADLDDDDPDLDLEFGAVDGTDAHDGDFDGDETIADPITLAPVRASLRVDARGVEAGARPQGGRRFEPDHRRRDSGAFLAAPVPPEAQVPLAAPTPPAAPVPLEAPTSPFEVTSPVADASAASGPVASEPVVSGPASAPSLPGSRAPRDNIWIPPGDSWSFGAALETEPDDGDHWTRLSFAKPKYSAQAAEPGRARPSDPGSTEQQASRPVPGVGSTPSGGQPRRLPSVNELVERIQTERQRTLGAAPAEPAAPGAVPDLDRPGRRGGLPGAGAGAGGIGSGPQALPGTRSEPFPPSGPDRLAGHGPGVGQRIGAGPGPGRLAGADPGTRDHGRVDPGGRIPTGDPHRIAESAQVSGPNVMGAPNAVSGPNTLSGPHTVSGPNTVSGYDTVRGHDTPVGSVSPSGPNTLAGPVPAAGSHRSAGSVPSGQNVPSPGPDVHPPSSGPRHARQPGAAYDSGTPADAVPGGGLGATPVNAYGDVPGGGCDIPVGGASGALGGLGRLADGPAPTRIPQQRTPPDNAPLTGRLCRERLTGGASSRVRAPSAGDPSDAEPHNRRDETHGRRRGQPMYRNPGDGRWSP